MTRLYTVMIWCLCLAAGLLAWPVLAWGQSAPVTAADVRYESFVNVNTNGNDTTYGQGLTHRYVAGELRFLTLANTGILHEFTTTGKAPGSMVNTTTASWDLGGLGILNNFNSINWEAGKNRLWVTSAEDYTNVVRPTSIALVTLGANGSRALIGRWSIAGVNAKRVYGGCLPVPAAAQATMGAPYVCGWGGYTSLVMQGGGASMGPFLVGIDEPTQYQTGAVLPVRKLILDAYPDRGVRKTIPQNYFDGGDVRQNPPSRPTVPPASSGQWLSPNAAGLGWWVWGDSPYNTGFFVTTSRGTMFGMIVSVCTGACWYQSSTLAFDGRAFELHLWDVAKLTGANRRQPPDLMVVLPLPDASAQVWGGNSPAGNIAGATLDPTSGKLYAYGAPFNTNPYDARLFTIAIAGVTSAPGPAPVPVPAVLSDWSAWTPTGEWTVCTGGTQTRPEERTRTIVTPAQHGAPAPTPADLLETRTASQACTVPTPTPTYPSPTAVPNRCVLTQPALPASPDGTTGWVMQLQRNGVNFGTADSTAPYGPRTYASLPLGTFVITAVWTKPGQPTVTTVLGSVVCGG